MSEEMKIISEYNLVVPVKQNRPEVEFLYDLLNPVGVPTLGYIGGSYAVWMTGDVLWTPGDVDVWAVSDEAWQAIIDGCKTHGYVQVGLTDIASVLSAVNSMWDDPIFINVVKPNPRWQNWPEDVINSFDLSVSRAVQLDREWIICDRLAGRKEGKILMVNDPLRTMERVLKYNSRGHVFSRWELLKLFRSWDEMSADRKQQMIAAHEPRPVVDDDEDYIAEDDREYGFYDDDYWDGE